MKNTDITDFKNAAKYYREEYDFNVIPLKARSKLPAIEWKEFQNRRASDEEFKTFDFKNVGVVTGKTSRIVVVDVDDPDKAEKWLAEQGFELPETATVKTARGTHLYYRIPDGVEVRSKVIVDGVLELKGDGSQVVAPPSVVVQKGRDRKGIDYADVHQYEWIHSPDEVGIAECPEWLLKANIEPSEGLTTPVEATIEEGSRNTTLFRLARSLFRKGLNETEVFETIYAVNQNRCKPPLDNEEVRSIVESAAKYERGELRIEEPASPSSSLKGNDNDDGDLPEVCMFSDLTPTKGKRPYIIDGVVFKGHAAALYGDGGAAKSTVAMHMGQCVARGEKWLGFETVKTKVLYLDFELDQEEQTRRAYEVAAGEGYAEPPEGFFYLPAAGYPTRPMFDHALGVCEEQGIGMVIVDSLGYALGGDSEASRDVLEFFGQVEGSFRRAGITLLIVDHQAKTKQGSNYRDMTMFGSVYKTNSVRSVFQVEPNTHDAGFIDLIVRHKKVNFGPLLNR